MWGTRSLKSSWCCCTLQPAGWPVNSPMHASSLGQLQPQWTGTCWGSAAGHQVRGCAALSPARGDSHKKALHRACMRHTARSTARTSCIHTLCQDTKCCIRYVKTLNAARVYLQAAPHLLCGHPSRAAGVDASRSAPSSPWHNTSNAGVHALTTSRLVRGSWHWHGSGCRACVCVQSA